MDSATVNWLWDQIYLDVNAIERELMSCSEYYLCHFHRTYGENTKFVIINEYDTIRATLKRRFYISENDDQGRPNLIDQHKIAACFCKAFINKKIFAFDINENTPNAMFLSNYKIAYQVSMRIIYLYLLDYYIGEDSGLDENRRHDCICQLQKWKSLKVPQTTQSHDSYNLGRIKTLALNDYYGIEVDLLTYADMMYWIELYNKMILEGRINTN